MQFIHEFSCTKTFGILTEMALEYGISSKGKQTLIYKNYEYVKDVENVCGTVAWRCRFYQSAKCKARVTTGGGRVVSNREPEHNHSGNIATSLARKAVGEMKEKMCELSATPGSSQAAVMTDLDDHVLMALPKRTTVSQALRRHKVKIGSASSGIILPPIPVDLTFAMPDLFSDIVQFDSGPGDNRIIIISCPELLDGLARSSSWLADGTFKVTPTLFFQLYSIHFDFGNGVCPAAVFCLLTNKTAETYERLLTELKKLIPLAAPQSILVDFEKAAINSFSTAFPSASVRGCYFHLCQSVVRKVNEVGIKSEYETSNEVRGFIRCLPALAFVPPEDVVESFELLVETMPQQVDRLDEIVTYFEHTYIRGRRRT